MAWCFCHIKPDLGRRGEASDCSALLDGDAVALDSRIEITLSNGHRLSVSGGFDPDAVSRLVRGLAS